MFYEAQASGRAVALFERLARVPSPPIAIRIAFHSAWVAQGLSLREDFGIDEALPATLANFMPGYSGPPIEVFRGERWSNYQSGRYGPSWSTKESVGRMFASRLSPETTSVLLRTIAPPHAILVSYTEHPGHIRSEYEVIVDRRFLGHIDVIERFPPELPGKCSPGCSPNEKTAHFGGFLFQ
ncbi:MAG: hypothetical protein WBE71_19220 [Xanthobacteraceae bacterium]